MSLRPSSKPPRASGARPWRWIMLFVASVLLHVLAFDWVDGSLTLPSWHTAPEQVVTADLEQIPAPPPIPQAAPATKPPEPATPKPKHVRPTPPPAVATPPAVAAVPSSPEPAAGSPAPGTSEDAPVSVAEQPAVPDTTVAPAVASDVAPGNVDAPKQDSTPRAAYKFSAPPPAELQYDVEAKREGQTWHGHGMYRWETKGDDYSITTEASIRLLIKITVLNSRSEGKLESFGIAPVLYTEKPFRKSATNTHFQHENHKITFSASEASFPYVGGEQDRSSILFQLAGFGRADPAQYQAGGQFSVVVAGVRDAETWQLQVVGKEEANIAGSMLSTWHVVRAPRPGTYDSRIDIWLAPQKEWYPVRLRYTYPNTDYLDMSLSDVEGIAR